MNLECRITGKMLGNPDVLELVTHSSSKADTSFAHANFRELVEHNAR